MVWILQEHFWKQNILKDVASNLKTYLINSAYVYGLLPPSESNRASKRAVEIAGNDFRALQLSFAAKMYHGSTRARKNTVTVTCKDTTSVQTDCLK